LDWQLWEMGNEVRRVAGIRPVLASWMAKTHPDQIKLQAFLDRTIPALTPLPSGHELFLHMEIDVIDPKHLSHHHDVENYVTPLFGGPRLDPTRFVFVSARKRVGGESHITIGTARPRKPQLDPTAWAHFSCTMSGSPQTKQWKSQLRTALTKSGPTTPGGSLEVHLAWRCSDRYCRNWVSLWKPTGDAMGPILGEPFTDKPFYPNDDRITYLGLHLRRDEAMELHCDVGIWWRQPR